MAKAISVFELARVVVDLRRDGLEPAAPSSPFGRCTRPFPRGVCEQSSRVSNAGFTLSVYGHMFDADLDDLASRLDEPRNASRPEFSRPARGLHAVNRVRTERGTGSDLHECRGAGRDRTFDRGIMSPLL